MDSSINTLLTIAAIAAVVVYLLCGKVKKKPDTPETVEAVPDPVVQKPLDINAIIANTEKAKIQVTLEKKKKDDDYVASQLKVCAHYAREIGLKLKKDIEDGVYGNIPVETSRVEHNGQPLFIISINKSIVWEECQIKDMKSQFYEVFLKTIGEILSELSCRKLIQSINIKITPPGILRRSSDNSAACNVSVCLRYQESNHPFSTVIDIVHPKSHNYR